MFLMTFSFPFSGLASIIAAVFLLLLGTGVIGGNFENPEVLQSLAKKKKKYLLLGGILLVAGIAILIRHYIK